MEDTLSVDFLRLKEYLDTIVHKVNSIDFIELDPISVPHCFSDPEDIEISGFFSAMLSWGNRKTIINKSLELMSMMDNHPFDFIIHHTENDLKSLHHFKHRTFQGTDLLYFIDFLHRFYSENKSLETAFRPTMNKAYHQEEALTQFHTLFFDHHLAPERTKKHIATPAKKSTCKRLNMYLRWMVRSDDRKVDFGLWKTIPASALMIPLDVHVENYARKLGLLTHKQRDWKAVVEITNHLRKMNPLDPVVYDYALFGLGVGLKGSQDYF
ncbi:MAG: TIGR02757 family protein [Saprospiraceae bacterium]|nr:TIGR02757 family protein [Saprospiraceae bacterium]